MAFAHSKKGKVYGSGVDLSSFLRAATSSGAADVAETSTMGADDKSFILGMVEGSISLEGIFSARAVGSNPQEVQEVLMGALGGADVVVCHLPQGDGFGNVVYGFKAIQNAVEVSSPTDDVVSISGELTSNTGLKSARSLHPKGAEGAGAATGTALDAGATGTPTVKGGVGFIEVFAVNAAGSVAGKIQHSTDNVTWVDLITFTTQTAGETAEAIVLPAATSVRRYVRASWTVVGGATFHISFARN